MGQGLGAEALPLRTSFQRNLHYNIKFSKLNIQDEESYQLCLTYGHQSIVKKLRTLTFLTWNSSVNGLNVVIAL